MNKKLTEISPDLTIPGFDVKVGNDGLSGEVKSQDGRYEFSVKIDGRFIRIYSPMFAERLVAYVGPWKACGIQFTTDADDAITQTANSLKLMDKLSSEGFSAKIVGSDLVLSHPSKPDYSLRIAIFLASGIVPLKNSSLYTEVEYCGPAYDEKSNTKWKVYHVNNHRLVSIDKDFDKFCQELKTRVLSLGEEEDPRIAQWVTQEIENTLAPQGFTFSQKPEKAIVEFSHPTGVSGSLSFAPFTAGFNYVLNPKYPNPNFPTVIEREKVVLFTCNRPNSREPYTKAFLAENPQEVIHEFRRFLALPLLHREVCHAWKSDILVPKLNGDSLQLVNTKIEGDDSIILELTVEEDKLSLNGKGNRRKSYKISDDPGKIAQTIADLAEKHVQEFIQENGIKLTNTRVVEIDF
jgi:hypothetical protein